MMSTSATASPTTSATRGTSWWAIQRSTTLRAEDQRVIGTLADEVVGGRGIGASFARLPQTFSLDNNVQALLFARQKPIATADYVALVDTLAAHYPDNPPSAPSEPE